MVPDRGSQIGKNFPAPSAAGLNKGEPQGGGNLCNTTDGVAYIGKSPEVVTCGAKMVRV